MLADTYNTANKLVGVTKGTSSIVYAYSGLGDRLKQIADGVTTDYVLDINAGLTQVLQDNTNKYVYGNQRISQIAETQTGYFLPDALGSMRQMTDSSADLTLARTYEPYGNIVSSSGAGETVYGFTGEMQSDGLVHLRARDYTSQLGRFTSRDIWEGNTNEPISYNKWLYGNSNPVIYFDPTGKLSCKDKNESIQCFSKAQILNQEAKQIQLDISAPYPKRYPVESFAHLADKAYELFEGDVGGTMWGLTNVLVGVDPNSYSVWKIGLEGAPSLVKKVFGVTYDRSKNSLFVGEQWLAFNKNLSDHYSDKGDWDERYFDTTSNQAFHFMYSVSAGYYNTSFVSFLANIVHDPYYLECIFGNDLEKLKAVPIIGFIPNFTTETSREDFNLAMKGIELVPVLKTAVHKNQSFNFGTWIRDNLQNKKIQDLQYLQGFSR